MEKTQYSLCCEILRRLDREGVLENVALIEAGEESLLKERFLSCPAKWRKTILKTLQDEPLAEGITAVLQ